MKYTFNTLEELKTAIEQWFITLGYDNKERAEKQYLKIIAEVGEMADALCKEDKENFKSEAGDVFVTIVGYCLQFEIELKELDKLLIYKMIYFENILFDNLLKDLIDKEFVSMIGWLHLICQTNNTTLLECATIAYNKIQKRLEDGKLSIKNGTIVK